MGDIDIFLFLIYVTIFIVAFPLLLIVLWAVNKWIWKGKIRLLYRILLSIAIPLAFFAIDYVGYYHSLYSTSNMDSHLRRIGVGITLPTYEITEYNNEHVMADDFRNTYHIVFKDANIESFCSTLDSVCNANSNWTKKGNKYVFTAIEEESGLLDTLTINPHERMATFVAYKW